ncbi:MAG TPA: YihY/virulence factor BrkB family protein [Deltaproteobacteria bacterium]|nr:YihY/virulence factor BrkB family protein [Deltaproteobacteria bacterium]
MKDPARMIADSLEFIRTGIWRIRLKDLAHTRRFLIKYLRVFIIALKDFIEDKCPLRASALTFYSLLSVVPVVAMAFAIAKGFGFQQKLEMQLMEKFAGQEAVIMKVIEFSRNMLDNTKGGLIAGVGVAVLLWAVISVLGQIEESFNDIWGIKKSRSFGRKFSDYLSMILIAPILLIISSSATVLITTRIEEITSRIALLGFFSPLISMLLKALPYGLIWILFAFIYIFMPNRKVSIFSGFFAGITAGTIFVIVQKIYILFQIGVAKYNAIYGSFAALPLFLVWLQLSWLIVLFGAELSFSHQNVETFEFEPDRKRISPFFKKLLSLQLLHMLVKNFAAGGRPVSAPQICEALDMPIRLVREIIGDLMECSLISSCTVETTGEEAYQPGRDISEYSIAFIMDTLDNKGTDTIPVARTEALNTLSESLRAFYDTLRSSPSNILLKDI